MAKQYSPDHSTIRRAGKGAQNWEMDAIVFVFFFNLGPHGFFTVYSLIVSTALQCPAREKRMCEGHSRIRFLKSIHKNLIRNILQFFNVCVGGL